MISRSKCRRGRPAPCGTGSSGSRTIHSSLVKSLGYLWPRRSYRSRFCAVQSIDAPVNHSIRAALFQTHHGIIGAGFPNGLLQYATASCPADTPYRTTHPETNEELIAHLDTGGRMIVYSGGSER